MKVHLVDRFSLTDEHAASINGQPVLVDAKDGTAYGPDDPIPWGDRASARAFVRSFLKTGFLSKEERAFAKSFINLKNANSGESVH